MLPVTRQYYRIEDRTTLLIVSHLQRLPAIMSSPLASSVHADELQNLKRQVERLQRQNEILRERLQLEERDHQATKADLNEDIAIERQRNESLSDTLEEALCEAREQRTLRKYAEERLMATMTVEDWAESLALSTPVLVRYTIISHHIANLCLS